MPRAIRTVMPVEGRDLSSRRTQHVVRDLEIGEPINSEECSETTEGVARESEGRSRLPFLCPVRQGQRRGLSTLAPLRALRARTPVQAWVRRVRTIGDEDFGVAAGRRTSPGPT